MCARFQLRFLGCGCSVLKPTGDTWVQQYRWLSCGRVSELKNTNYGFTMMHGFRWAMWGAGGHGGICEDWFPSSRTLYSDGYCTLHQPDRLIDRL
jgi:hypothetical protein